VARVSTVSEGRTWCLTQMEMRCAFSVLHCGLVNCMMKLNPVRRSSRSLCLVRTDEQIVAHVEVRYCSMWCSHVGGGYRTQQGSILNILSKVWTSSQRLARPARRLRQITEWSPMPHVSSSEPPFVCSIRLGLGSSPPKTIVVSRSDGGEFTS
jgi:hypothetical protein